MAGTMYVIAEAVGTDEQSTNNGITGEQTGFELIGRKYYKNPWSFVFRANDENVREQIADFMEKAIANGFIGYDQTDRNTLFDELSLIDFNVEELNTPCECDCSSLVYCALYPIFKIPRYEDNVRVAPVTSYYETYLDSIGAFTKYSDSTYTDIPDNLLRGDILLNPGVHVAVYI